MGLSKGLSTQKIGIPKELEKKFKDIRKYQFTIINAPPGYGKTITVAYYMKVLGITNKTIYNTDFSKMSDFCEAIEGTDDASVVVFDDVVHLDRLTLRQCAESTGRKAVFISDSVVMPDAKHWMHRDLVNVIGKNELKFTPDTIREFFEMNTISISAAQAKELYQLSDGWPYMIVRFMRQYTLNKSFYAKEAVNTFLNDEIFAEMPEKEKIFFVKVSQFTAFTLKQAAAVNDMELKRTAECLDRSVLVSYHSVERTYTLNPLVRQYLATEYNELPIAERNVMFSNLGDMHSSYGDIFRAISCYHTAGDYEKMYALDVDLRTLYPFIIKENKEIFFDAVLNYASVENALKYRFALILTMVLFLYHEPASMQEFVQQINDDIDKDTRLNDGERTRLHMELNYIKAFAQFNDIQKMAQYYDSVPEFTIGSLQIFTNKVPFMLSSPSMLMLYHAKPGKLAAEVKAMDEFSKMYYRISDGHGKGFEALMRAEYLFNMGDIEGAEILSHKVLYMADSRLQTSIFLGGLLLLCKIALFAGDEVTLNKRMELFYQKISDDNRDVSEYRIMVDMCRGSIYTIMGDVHNIPAWLKDEKQIEKKTNFVSLAYANLIYGRYLLLEKRYQHLLGIGGQLLGVAEVYSYVLARIYTYIYLAVANYNTGSLDKASNFVREATQLAVEDNFYFPFAMNYEMMKPILEKMVLGSKETRFYKNVKRISAQLEKSVKALIHNMNTDINYGLTARELDVAKLAAKRMSNREIADVLVIAESTVKSNMKSIFSKMGITSRSELSQIFD